MDKHQLNIKASDDGKFWDISGYAVLFDMKDLGGTMFTKSTDFWEGMTSDTPPLLFDHGMDDKVGLSFVGQVKKKTVDEVGIWFEAQMDRANRYADAIAQMIRSHKMGVSTGTSPHTLSISDGVITTWPILEISLTPTPMEPKTIEHLSQKSLADPEQVTDEALAEGLTVLLETVTGTKPEESAIKAHLGLARSVLAAVISKGEPTADSTGDPPVLSTEGPNAALSLSIKIEQFKHGHSAVTYK